MYDMQGVGVLIYFGIFGVIVALIGTGWLLYHLIMAVVQYTAS